MAQSKKKLLVDFFLKNLKEKASHGYGFYSLYLSLFSILPADELNTVLEEAYSNRKMQGWFASFHKVIRQTDYFSNCFRFEPQPKIEREEMKELHQLNEELKKVNVKMDAYELTIKKMVPPIDHPDYVQKQAEYSVAYKKRYRELFPIEKLNRRYDLNQKLKHEEKRSINGHLDNALWHAIHADTNELLYNILIHTFDDFLEEKRKSTRLKKMAK